jgi:hypothetical protein
MSETQSPSRADAVEDFLPAQYLLAVEHGKTSIVPDISSCLRIIELTTSSSSPLGRNSAFVLAPDSWQNFPTTARAVGACLTGQPGGSSRKRRGPKPKFAGPIREVLDQLFEERGDPRDGKRGWSRQSDVERAVFEKLNDKAPSAESTVREHVSKFLKDREKMKADNSII